MPHDFSDVAVKENAAELLDDALSRKRRKCMIGFGSMSDPYIPAEKELGLTRRCLEIISRRGPVGIGKACATVDGKVAVTAELTFAIQ